VFRSNRNRRETEGLLVYSTGFRSAWKHNRYQGVISVFDLYETRVFRSTPVSTTEPESLTGIITKPKQNRKRVEPDDATVTVLVVDGRGQQDIRECTADEDQPQQKGSGVVVGDPSGNHMKEEERGREERHTREAKNRKEQNAKREETQTKNRKRRETRERPRIR
jgi:hypothetical protein